MVGVAADFWRAQNGTNHITPGGKWTPEGAWIADFLAGLAGKEIVEFGCGPGRLAQHFDPARYLVDGASEAMTTREISVDVTFPRGLFVVAGDGSRSGTTVETLVQYRKSGDVTWLDAPWENDTDTGFTVDGKITTIEPKA